ncbi:MAG: hypothetical protein IPM54_25300 [Polyangiaceae bacterium]|nr:hypothetical protein [Polyangiaceae bacterium]
MPAWCDETPGGTRLDECRLSVQRYYGLPWWCAEFLDGADAGDAADGASSACSNGTCAMLPDGWEPVVLASGAMVVLPECPTFAPNVMFEGSSVPGVDPTCPACSCDAPVGACKPPTTWTVGSSACIGNDVWTNFDPPAGWDGSCASNTAIAEGILCGGKPCVASINISPPVIEEAPCVAHATVPPIDIPKAKADGPYTTEGLACSGDPWPACATAGERCVPSVNDPFAACVMHEGDVLCPNGWDSKQVLYGMIDDQRTCSECSCLPSTGATCSMKVQLFGDAACSTTELEVNVSVDMASDCHLLMPGVALAGKRSDVLEYKPGACEPSGGELLGDVVLADARTFCCRTPTI